MTKPVTSFRIDPNLIKKARKEGLDVTKMIEAMLAKAINDKKCPYCGK